jgi:uncharacterized protein YdeI (YjbR/CyaY-like superfamily)
MNPKVDLYLSKAKKWRAEMEQLRRIILDCGLTEEVKWNIPVYTSQKRNIVAINALKESCALAFFKGVLLHDTHCILLKPGKHSQTGRWIKFTSVREIVELEPILKAYIHEATEVEKAGLNIIHKKTSDYPVPEEFQNALDESPALKAAFDALTPGRQRAYLFYFATPKQSQTRTSRVEKCMQQILDGVALNDEYIKKK